VGDAEVTSGAQVRRAIGVDGCPSGWVVVMLEDGAVADVTVVDGLGEHLTGVAEDLGELGGVAVDIPIGLIDADRDADRAARRLLPGRASSVFSTPPRSVVDAWAAGQLATHAEASALARAVSGKGLSQQAWRLVPKIAEVDGLAARGHPLLEVHPEVAFAIVVGAALPRKRSWAGITMRRAVLERLGIVLPDRFPGDESAAPDDVVDAAICAWVADGSALGERLVPVPEHTTQRAHDRPIVISARRPPPVIPGPPRRPLHRDGWAAGPYERSGDAR
jgi:predicted RNase H-like nuclease